MRPAVSADWKAMVQRCIDVDKKVFVQLATLTGDGLPSVRTVVFRGWHAGETWRPELKFITDIRSEKMNGLRGEENWAEVCYYSAGTRQQFRFTGTLAVIGNDNGSSEHAYLRKNLWSELSESARKKFCWPTPGAQRAVDEKAFDPPSPPSDSPVSAFAVLLLQPSKVDFYCSKTDCRDLFTVTPDTEQWTVESVNP